VNRIAIEELEAWFFGDVDALHAAYPRVSRHLANKAPYRDPDAITGGTAEALGRVLKAYYRTGLLKTEVAKKIAPLNAVSSSLSRSGFCCFRRKMPLASHLVMPSAAQRSRGISPVQPILKGEIPHLRSG